MDGSTFASARTLGIVSMAACALGLLYAPFHAVAYLATPDGSQNPPLVPWDDVARDLFPAAFDFASPQGVYLTYGRIAPFAMLGFVFGLLALRTAHGSEPTRLLRASYWALVATQSVLCASIFVEYYTPFLNEAFLVGFPALMLGIVAYVAFGIASVRAKTLPRDACWAVILGAGLVVPSIAMMGHIPIALGGVFVAWIRIGFMHVQTRQATARMVPVLAETS